MKVSLFVVFLLHVHAALAGISSSPGLQRKVLGSSCTFQWTVTGTVTQFVIYNQTTETPATLNSRGSQQFDSSRKTISLTITSIALWDAGNYTLSISNGETWENDSNALLFVFGSYSTYVSLPLGRNPATEGDSVEFNCVFTSSSLPVAYRPRLLYVWYLQRFSNNVQVLTNGSLQITNGDIVSGYSSRSGGKTLIIAPVQYSDAQNIRCSAAEEGSPSTNSWSSTIYFSVQYKPVVLSTTPQSRKFNAIVGEQIQLYVNVIANPFLLATRSNWTFVNLQGISMDIPDRAVTEAYSNPSLSFNLTSVTYYGSYSYDLTNAIGTSTVTFKVLPPGPPDPPAAFQVVYVTHFSIALQWNCMWSNFNSRYQYVYTELREQKSNVSVGAYNNSMSGTCYNLTNSVTFSSAIQPDKYYEANVWSTNEIGSSSVTKLSVRSAKVFRFVVSPDSIRIIQRLAIINYRVESGNITHFSVSCCYEITGACVSSYINVNNTLSQASLYTGSLPNGTEYVFDFTLYVGNTITAVVGSVKGIRVSTATGQTSMTAGNPDLSAAVIALAVLLAVAVAAIAGMSLGFFIWKRRHYFPASKPQKPNRSVTGRSEAIDRSEAVDEDQYEKMDPQTRESRIYTNLDQTKRT